MPQQPIDLEAVKHEAAAQLENSPGVEGVGLGDGRIRVYVRNTDVKAEIPDEFQGVPVEVVVTGDISTDW